jgi:methionine-rich copper-binding protein CopC
MRKIVTAFVGLLAGLALAFGAAMTATAHSELEGSTPAAGSTSASVTELVFTFGEEVVPEYSTVILTSTSGIAVDLADATYDATATVMTLPIVSGALPDGGYIAGFRIVSIDGHPISGEVDFTVAGSDAPALLPAVPSETETIAPTQEPMATDGSEALLVASQEESPSILVIVGSIAGAIVALGLVTVILLVAIRRSRAKAADTAEDTVTSNEK